MNSALLAWRNINHYRRHSIALILLSCLAMMMAAGSTRLGQAVRTGLTRAVEPFDLMVGHGGSYQMAISAVFLHDYPSGSVPHRLVDELRSSPLTAAVIPLLFGDNYRGYRIVGTDETLFDHTSLPGIHERWIRIAQGHTFTNGKREAVLGAAVARRTGLRVGDSFLSTHGYIDDASVHHHGSYIVCGIAEPCHGPYDKAIFVPIDTVWHAHGGDGPYRETGGSDESGAVEYENDDAHPVSAIVVRPAGYGEAYQLAAEFAARGDGDLIFPAEVVVRLFSLLGQAEWLLTVIGLTAVAMAMLTTFVVAFWSVTVRARDWELLRLLGAGGEAILGVQILEMLLTTVPGLTAGLLAGRLTVGFLLKTLAEHTALDMHFTHVWQEMTAMAILLLAAAAGHGAVWAWHSRRPSCGGEIVAR